MILEALHRIANHGQSLGCQEAREVMAEVLSAKCTDAQISALLVALRMKGETVEEIVGFAEAIRAAAAPLPVEAANALDVSGTGRDALAESSLVDTSGTGGDSSGTFNISTTAAFVAAGAGVRVAKHGNRSISSKCGSAGVLGAVGISLDVAPERVGAAIREIGIGFLFAPALHTAMRHAMPARRRLGRTAFNLLGPLTNPAGARAQIAGVFSAGVVEKVATALAALGVERAFVVHGAGGLDEISLT